MKNFLKDKVSMSALSPPKKACSLGSIISTLDVQKHKLRTLCIAMQLLIAIFIGTGCTEVAVIAILAFEATPKEISPGKCDCPQIYIIPNFPPIKYNESGKACVRLSIVSILSYMGDEQDPNTFFDFNFSGYISDREASLWLSTRGYTLNKLKFIDEEILNCLLFQNIPILFILDGKKPNINHCVVAFGYAIDEEKIVRTPNGIICSPGGINYKIMDSDIPSETNLGHGKLPKKAYIILSKDP